MRAICSRYGYKEYKQWQNRGGVGRIPHPNRFFNRMEYGQAGCDYTNDVATALVSFAGWNARKSGRLRYLLAGYIRNAAGHRSLASFLPHSDGWWYEYHVIVHMEDDVTFDVDFPESEGWTVVFLSESHKFDKHTAAGQLVVLARKTTKSHKPLSAVLNKAKRVRKFFDKENLDLDSAREMLEIADPKYNDRLP